MPLQLTILRNGHRLPIDCPSLQLLDLPTLPKKLCLRSSVNSWHTNPTWSCPPLSLSGFRGFHVHPRWLLSQTWKQASTLRVQGLWVLGEGAERRLTTRLNDFKLRLVAFRAWRYVRWRYRGGSGASSPTYTFPRHRS